MKKLDEELLKKVLELIKKDKGDIQRLEHIRDSIQEGKELYQSDQKYLDSLFAIHFSYESESEPPIDEPAVANKIEQTPKPEIQSTESPAHSFNEPTYERGITIVKDVLFHPTSAFKEMNQKNNVFMSGAGVLFLASAGLFSEGFFEGLGAMAGEIAVIGLVLYVGRGLGGKGNFSGIFSTFQYAGIPGLVASGLFLFLPDRLLDNAIELQPEELSTVLTVLGIAFILIIWTIILSIIAIRETHQFGSGRAFGVLVLSSIIFLIVFIPIVLALGLEF